MLDGGYKTININNYDSHRLASVQEQRMPNSLDSSGLPQPPCASGGNVGQGDIVDAAKNSNRVCLTKQSSSGSRFDRSYYLFKLGTWK